MARSPPTRAAPAGYRRSLAGWEGAVTGPLQGSSPGDVPPAVSSPRPRQPHHHRLRRCRGSPRTGPGRWCDLRHSGRQPAWGSAPRLSSPGRRPWSVLAHHETRVGGDSARSAGWRGGSPRPQIRPGPGSSRHPVPFPIQRHPRWPIDHRPRRQCHFARKFLLLLPPDPVGASRPSVQRQRHLLQARPRAPARRPASRPAARSLLLTSNSLSILLTMHARARTWRGQTFSGFPGTSGVPIGRLRARSFVEFCMPGSEPGSDVTRCLRIRPGVSWNDSRRCPGGASGL